MWTQNFWNFICFIFFYQSFSGLITTKNKVVYETVYDSYADESYLSICLKIDSEAFDCENLTNDLSSGNENKIVLCNQIRSFFDYIEDNNEKSPYQILKKYDEYKIPTLFEFNINTTELFRYLNSKSLCYLFKLNLGNLDELKTDFFLIKIFNKYHLSSRYFLHGEKIPRFFGRIESLNCINFKKCSYFSITVRQFKNKLLPAPFETDCVNHSTQKYSFKNFETIDVKSACIMENLKRKYRLYAFFYTINDNETLDYKSKRTSLDFEDVTKAISMCKSECEELLFTFLEITKNDHEFFGIWMAKKKFNNIAIPTLSTTNFWIYFFVLIALFFKVSFLSLIFKIKNLIEVNLNKSIKRSVLTIVLLTGIALNFVLGYFQSTILFENYVNRTFVSYVYREIPFQPAEFSSAVCQILNLNNVENLSLFQIENQTSSFLSNEDKFLLLFDEEIKVQKFDFKIFFKQTETQLQKCYQFEVRVEELRYRSLLSMTNLLINSTEFDLIYLGAFNRTMTTDDKYFDTLKNILRFEDYYSTDCTNYSITKHHCDSQQNCVDRCFLDQYLVYHQKLPINYNIYIRDFEDYEKKSLFFDFKNRSNQTILEKCKTKYSSKDCKSTMFLTNFNEMSNETIKSKKKDQNQFKINLFFEQVKRGLVSNLSIFSLISCFLLIYTVLIGISFPQICNFLICLINLFLKNDDKLSSKNWIFLFSLIGSSVHSYYLAKETIFSDPYINIDLQLNYLNSNQKIPNLLFCIKHNVQFRANQIVTGNLLDQKTEHLNESYLFKEIIYYDLNVTKQKWNPKKTEKSENFEIDYFFFLNYKCLEIKYRMNFNHVKNGNLLTILKIKFNKNLDHENYLFTSKLNGTDDFR